MSTRHTSAATRSGGPWGGTNSNHTAVPVFRRALVLTFAPRMLMSTDFDRYRLVPASTTTGQESPVRGYCRRSPCCGLATRQPREAFAKWKRRDVLPRLRRRQWSAPTLLLRPELVSRIPTLLGTSSRRSLKSALEGERNRMPVRFADRKGSTERQAASPWLTSPRPSWTCPGCAPECP